MLEFLPYYERITCEAHDIKGDFLFFTSKALFKNTTGDISFSKFVEGARKVLSDYLLIASFASMRKIHWFNFEGVVWRETEMQTIRYYKNYRVKTEEIPEYYCLIEHDKFEEFFSAAMTSYVKEKDRMNVENAIAYYLASKEEVTPEAKFALLCVSIETIANSFARLKRTDKIIGDKDFKRFKRFLICTVKKYASKEGFEGSYIKAVSDKMPELNRFPIKKAIQEILSYYKIKTRDIYRNDEETFEFLFFRNNLLHNGKINNIGLFMCHMERLEILTERILLRILGWDSLKGSRADKGMRLASLREF